MWIKNTLGGRGLIEERQYAKFKVNDTKLSVNYCLKLDSLDNAVCFGPEDEEQESEISADRSEVFVTRPSDAYVSSAKISFQLKLPFKS